MSKEDPLEQKLHGGRTLWLNRDNMEQARENYFRRWWEVTASMGEGKAEMVEAHIQWDISWAAAIAAYDYMMNGRVEPR